MINVWTIYLDYIAIGALNLYARFNNHFPVARLFMPNPSPEPCCQQVSGNDSSQSWHLTIVKVQEHRVVGQVLWGWSQWLGPQGLGSSTGENLKIPSTNRRQPSLSQLTIVRATWGVQVHYYVIGQIFWGEWTNNGNNAGQILWE